MKIVRIEWVDAAYADSAGWRDSSESMRLPKIVSVGILHHKTKKRVVYVDSVSDGGKVSGMNIIPRSSIRSMKRLR